MDLCDALIAGTDIWDSPDATIHTTNAQNYEDDPFIVTEMREAMHNILYTVVNSNAMNGLSEADRLEAVTPWWQTALYAAIAVFAVLTVISVVMLVRAIQRKKANTGK